jgi:hypothetical protein
MRFEVFMAVKMRILASWVTILKCYKYLCNLSQYINFLRLEDFSAEEHTLRLSRTACSISSQLLYPSYLGAISI